MSWLKKNWDKPITVGGYTKLCVICYVISVICGVLYTIFYVYPNEICSWLESCKGRLMAWRDKLRRRES